MKWTQIAFHIRWDYEQDPPRYLDTLIACEILQPILEDEMDNLIYWRFHRRACKDHAGQIFRLSVYAKKKFGERIIEDVLADPLLEKLQASGLVSNVTTERKEHIADERWHESIQSAWCPFIQGVCGCWLSLAMEYAKEPRKLCDGTVIGLCEAYICVEKKLSEVWREELSHPILHHLNALFGYGHMNVKATIQMQF